MLSNRQQQLSSNNSSQREYKFDTNHNRLHGAFDSSCYPEVSCHIDLQHVAARAEDTHVIPDSLEYLLPILCAITKYNPRIARVTTRGVCTTYTELVQLLAQDFKVLIPEENKDDIDYSALKVSEILRKRVYTFESASDKQVIKWTRRLINVGSFFRGWMARINIRYSAYANLELKLKERRNMYKKMMKTATTEFEKDNADRLQMFVKIIMNAIYGMTSTPDCKETCNFMVGSSITSCGRRSFINIRPTLQSFFPKLDLLYGDTDSVFVTWGWSDKTDHRILSDHQRNGSSNNALSSVIEVDLLLERTIASFLPRIINAHSKGFMFHSQYSSGRPMMNIEQERHTLHSVVDKKKCYFLFHWALDSTKFKKLENTLKQINNLYLAGRENEAEYVCSVFNDDENGIPPFDGRTITIQRNSQPFDGTYYPHTKLFLQTFGKNKRSSLRVSQYTVWLDLSTICTTYYNLYMRNQSDRWVDPLTQKLISGQRAKRCYSLNGLLGIYLKGIYVKETILKDVKRKIILSVLHDFSKGEFNHLVRLKDEAKEYLNFLIPPHNMMTLNSVKKIPSVNQNLQQKRILAEEEKVQAPFTILPIHNAIGIHNKLCIAEEKIDIGIKTYCVNCISFKKLSSKLMTWCDKREQSRASWCADREKGTVTCGSAQQMSVCVDTIHYMNNMNDKLMDKLLTSLKNQMDRLKQLVEGKDYNQYFDETQQCIYYGFNIRRTTERNIMGTKWIRGGEIKRVEEN